MNHKMLCTWLLCAASVSHAETMPTDILPVESAARVGPVARHLTAPESLRPCCAFGYGLRVRAIGVPVPFYQIGNVLSAGSLGTHHYNDSALSAVKSIVGLSAEKSGLIYTRRGGFIDIAHVRDTADNTFYLFTRIYPRLGSGWRLFYSEELGLRRIQLKAFTRPHTTAERYTLAAWLAGHLAFQLAQWHEIAQWYGFQSVKGFSEEISAFSPEDLYSNLLGARLAINVILHGHAGSPEKYNAAMGSALHDALIRLGAVSEAETKRQFHEVDGIWWNSKRRVPDKFLVLNRNYDLSDSRFPTPVPFEKIPPYRLTMPETVAGYRLSARGELQIYPGSEMHGLKTPAHFYTPSQFPALAEKAKYADQIQLQKLNK
ncbi:uncharacterized protein DUF4056 [Rahnella sp. BIGb0236]|nr:uncharacterized protein DUF4056 [Rahnella sp. BIGb0236]